MFTSPSVGESLSRLMRSSSYNSGADSQRHQRQQSTNSKSSPTTSAYSPSIFGSSNSSMQTSNPISIYSSTLTPPPQQSASNLNIFSRSYIEQAIRLAHDALAEQSKGHDIDQSYAVDCYLASIEYLLSALSTGSAAEVFGGLGVDRQAVVNTKLTHLLERIEDLQDRVAGDEVEYVEEDEVVPGRRWSLMRNLIPSRLLRTTQNITESVSNATPSRPLESSQVVEPTELVGNCACGRKVIIPIPRWLMMADMASNQHNSMEQLQNRQNIGWPETIITSIFSFILMIRQSSIPSWITFLITSFCSLILFIEHQFQLRKLAWQILLRWISALKQLDAEVGLNQVFMDTLSWGLNNTIRILVAFSGVLRSEGTGGTRPREQLHDHNRTQVTTPPNIISPAGRYSKYLSPNLTNERFVAPTTTSPDLPIPLRPRAQPSSQAMINSNQPTRLQRSKSSQFGRRIR